MGCFLACPSTVYGDVVADLAASRKKLKPFHAVYREKIVVHNRPTPSTKGAILGWGASNSTLDIEASVDSTCSQIRYAKMAKRGGPTGKIYFNAPDRTWDFIEDGMRGAFGTRPSGMTNPAAAAYEIHSEEASNYLKKYRYTIVSPTSIQIDQLGANVLVQLRSFGAQTVIESVESAGSSTGVSTSTRVVAWLENRGQRYPRKVLLEIYKAGQLSQSREYYLVKVLPSTKELQVPLKEGALLKNNTEPPFLVYDVKSGKLVPNDDFNKGRTATDFRRVALIAAFCVFGSWIYIRVRSRGSRAQKLPR